MAKYTIRNLKFLSKHFGENGKKKLILNDSSFLSNLKNALQSKFNKFLQTYFIFLITHLLVIFVNEDIFFPEYIQMELKIFFIIFEEFFEWQK